jgi:hypothetical protein
MVAIVPGAASARPLTYSYASTAKHRSFKFDVGT